MMNLGAKIRNQTFSTASRLLVCTPSPLLGPLSLFSSFSRDWLEGFSCVVPSQQKDEGSYSPFVQQVNNRARTHKIWDFGRQESVHLSRSAARRLTDSHGDIK